MPYLCFRSMFCSNETVRNWRNSDLLFLYIDKIDIDKLLPEKRFPHYSLSGKLTGVSPNGPVEEDEVVVVEELYYKRDMVYKVMFSSNLATTRIQRRINYLPSVLVSLLYCLPQTLPIIIFCQPFDMRGRVVKDSTDEVVSQPDLRKPRLTM